jgi:hypothetical protein
MRKTGICFFFVLAAAGVFGADFSLSAGGGGLLGYTFTRYTLEADGFVLGNHFDARVIQKLDQFRYGGFVFFDATYAEFSITLHNGIGAYQEIQDIESRPEQKKERTDRETMLAFALYGKYPFTLRANITVFPLLGVEYQVSLIQKRSNPMLNGASYDRTNGEWEHDKNSNHLTHSMFNSFWINLGGGVDFYLTPVFFLRGELVYGFRLMTPYEKDGLEQAKRGFNDDDPRKRGLTSGPVLRFAAGYKFFS